jgi:alanine racemase
MRRAWVDIDLGALLRNGAALAAQAGVPLLPMVKADAYGLGAVRIARTLERLDPWGFGVAMVAEGEELRRAAIKRPIVVFTPMLSGDFDAAVRANLTPSLGSAEQIAQWRETRRPWQLAIDTGMSRAGIQWNEIASIVELVRTFPPEGAFTHFHSAERKDGTREQQEERFAQALAALPIRLPMIHADNSPAVEHRGRSPYSVVRPGVFLYGVGSGSSPLIVPEPVVALRSRIIDLRTVPDGDTVSYDATYTAKGVRRIATLGVGYADGYRRAFGNRATVLLHGRWAPVAGLVTMDMTMIDVTDIPCEIGDVATLIGSDGDERIDVADLAAIGEMSPYEILTGLRARVPRRYFGADA